MNAQGEQSAAALDLPAQAGEPEAAAPAAVADPSASADEQPAGPEAAELQPATAVAEDSQSIRNSAAATSPAVPTLCGNVPQAAGMEAAAGDASEHAAVSCTGDASEGSLPVAANGTAAEAAQEEQPAGSSSAGDASLASQPCEAAPLPVPCTAPGAPAPLPRPLPAEDASQGCNAGHRHATTQTEPPALPVWHQQRRAAVQAAAQAAEQAGRMLQRMAELGGEWPTGLVLLL